MRKSKGILFGILVCCVGVLFSLYCCSATAEHAQWDCPECGRMGNTGNYCGKCAHPAPWKKEAFQTVGNIVRFGHYEQDNNLENGQEEIEWIVLDVQEGKSLLISRYGLSSRPYNTVSGSVTWESCTLRRWLNKDFLQTAFEPAEQLAILITNVDNSKPSRGGNDTQDQFFLLSYHEAFLYFQSNDTRQCAPTDYAEEQGASTSINYKVDGRATGWWWLRSPGTNRLNSAGIYYDGLLRNGYYNSERICVRPAFWINLESGIF